MTNDFLTLKERTTIIKDIKNHEKDIDFSVLPVNNHFHRAWEDIGNQIFSKGDMIYLSCAMMVRGVYFNLNHNKRVVYVEYKLGFMESEGDKWFPEDKKEEVKRGKNIFFPRR